MAQRPTTNLIPSSLPVYFQCLRVPCEVRTSPRPHRTPGLEKLEMLRALMKPGTHTKPVNLYWYTTELEADIYDPWEERARFFRIKEGDNEGLIKFLQSVGLFKSPELPGDPDEHTSPVTDPDGLHHTARYTSEMAISAVWSFRRAIENSLQNLRRHTGRYKDFDARIILMQGQPKVLITTCTFFDSVLLTLAVDRVQRAKVRKCARPDCEALFSSVSAHAKKFCCWYCGHLESVRKQRRNAKRAKKQRSSEGGK